MPLTARIALLALLGFGAAAGVQSPPRDGRTDTGIAFDGQGRGPVVVLISGSNLDRRMWAREAQWLARDHTVVRYDLRAHGQSDTATAPFSHLADLAAVLDALHISRATLIGLSAGSTIALDAALAWPERIERIVLAGVSISGYVPKERPPFPPDLMAALKAGDYRRASEALLATPTFAAPAASQALVRTMVTENERLWTVPRELMQAPAKPAAARLEEVKVPMLVLVGEHDAPAREQTEVLRQRVPAARVVVIPGGSHLLNLTSPAAFESAVREFLR